MTRIWLTLACTLLLAAPAAAQFPRTAPDDPEYDRADENCAQYAVSEQQYFLHSDMSPCTPQVSDPDGAMGMSVDAVWRDYTIGNPDVRIAYVEAGVNWHGRYVEDLVHQVYLNAGELPAPTTPVEDGRLNVKDYADTRDANGNGLVDPEDVIVRFQDGRDGDRNGYTDDISGWDTYHDQNDPATYDATYNHANSQMRRAAGETDNGLHSASMCPGCTLIPVKAGAEALDRTDDLAEAWLYAADAGADVIVSVTADLGYSSLMRQTVEKLWRRGVVMVEASNDFDSTDHQGGMFHPFVVPANSIVANTAGLTGGAANALTTTYRARAGKTSWGTKNFLSVASQDGSTSAANPMHGGAYALVKAVGDEAVRQGKLAAPLTGQEVLQVARATASDISGSTNWPSKEGWDLHFGYGRPHLHRAAQAVFAGDVPPVGWISSPEWYALYNPARKLRVPVRGRVEAPRSPSYRWRLEWAAGAEPADGEFRAAGEGKGRRPFEGRLGVVDLADLPRDFWEKEFALSRTKSLETNEHYTVTLRLRVYDAAGRMGEDRRSIAVHRDPSWVPGFPRRVGPGAESSPQLADLQGTGREAIVFGDADGRVHAVDAVERKELPGWPVRTRRNRLTKTPKGIRVGREPVVSNVAVGDLDGSGRLSVVATSSSGRTYVWSARGKLRRGWPRRLDTGVATPPVPRPKLDYTRLGARGAFAPPVLHDLDGDRRLDVIQAGWDGRLHAWRRDGRELPGWPVEVTVPDGLSPGPGLQRLNDHKLSFPPAVADLDGDGRAELVLRSQYLDVRGDDIQPAGAGYVHAYRADGSPVPGWPVRQNAVVTYYGSGQEFITEGTHVPAAADVDGDGDDEVVAGQIFSPPQLLDGDGSVRATYGPTSDPFLGVLNDPLAYFSYGAPPVDAPLTFAAAGAFGRFGGGALAYAEPGSMAASIAAALLVPGPGLPIRNVLRAHDAAAGTALPGYPADQQGLNFLGGVTFADVDGDGGAEMLEGGDSSAMHAFAATGTQAEGFPKFHSGWTLYSPAAGDVDGDGTTDVVASTREGYLFAWRTEGAPEGNQEWWSYRHDERNTSRHGTDTRPPGAAQDVRLRRGGREVAAVAPGGDWYAGRAERWFVRFRPVRGRRARTITAPIDASGSRDRIPLPRRARRVTLWAEDGSGNRGRPVTVSRRTRARRGR